MIKSIGLLTRKPELTHEQFVTHWKDIHGPLAYAVPGIKRYVQNDIVGQPSRPDIPDHQIAVDGIAEIWWESKEAMLAAHNSPELNPDYPDEVGFSCTFQSNPS